MKAVPPATIGRYAYGRLAANAISFVVVVPLASRFASWNGISDTAKSTCDE
jgi:hypothetical protein